MTTPPAGSAIARLLAERTGGHPEGVESLAGGAWSSVWAVRLGGRDLVVRWSAVEEDFSQGRARGAIRLPRPTGPAGHREIGEAFGGWFAVTERHLGTALEELDARGMRAMLPSLLATLDALRMVDVSDSHGFGSWNGRGDGAFPTWQSALLEIGAGGRDRRTRDWRARLADRPTAQRVFESAYTRLGICRPIYPRPATSSTATCSTGTCSFATIGSPRSSTGLGHVRGLSLRHRLVRLLATMA
jgi:hygromycin-B 4-O-kinase